MTFETLRSRLAALLVALAAPVAVTVAGPAAAQINFNEIENQGAGSVGGAPDAPPAAAETDALAAIPQAVQTAQTAQIAGFESRNPWYVVNNSGTNLASSIALSDGRQLRAARLLVYVNDVEWRTGRTAITTPVPSDRPAGEGFLFPGLPPYTIVVYQPANRIAFQIDATDHRQPNLLTLQTDDPITVIVNDRNSAEAYADNSGSFDFFFRLYTQ